MFELVREAKDILQTADIDWGICGGLAVDLFHGNLTRKHLDLDICVFWENRGDVINLMKDTGWMIYEYCGGGKSHLIHNADEQEFPNNNLFCVKGNNKALHLTYLGDNMYEHSMDQIEQRELDFLDFLFNRREGNCLILPGNHGIKRELSKAFCIYEDIPYLSPEIVLLYKSMESEREDYEHDFNITIGALDSERKTWLVNSLKVSFPQGHNWLNLING